VHSIASRHTSRPIYNIHSPSAGNVSTPYSVMSLIKWSIIITRLTGDGIARDFGDNWETKGALQVPQKHSA
jgi:hypothetical protein